MKNQGFTLIELSIVMVIIGLIIGGILTGQELIHGAGVRATISQILKYNSAVNTFQMKYNALPGDFKNADAYIAGSQHGNGDGLIGWVEGPPTATAVNTTANTPNPSAEYGNFWSHLSALGLIEAGYVAISSPYTHLLSGGNFPAVKMNQNVGI